MSIPEVIEQLKENSVIADPGRRGLNVCVEKELLRMAAVYLEDYMLCLEQMNANKGKKPVTYNDANRADCPICGATVRGLSRPFGDYCSHCGQKLDWSDTD